MELKETRERNPQTKRNSIFVALILITAGAVLIGRNLGYVEHYIYRIVISWQMLLIVLGLSMIRKQPTSGIVLIGVGTFFLLPHITNVGHNWMGTYWPVIFVFAGIIIIVNMFRKKSYCHSWEKGDMFKDETLYTTDEGFVNSDISFGSVRQIVLAPVFKGARISNRFAGTVLDLRHSSLEAEETYIDVDNSFGGVEIYVPENWMVKVATQNFFGGTDDKRYKSARIEDQAKKLIIRGSVSFGGLEIKN